MDFQLSEDEQALQQLAGRVVGDHAAPGRLRDLEKTGESWDEKLWIALAASGVLSAGLSEESGGGGLGLVGTCVLLEEVGRHVAPVPAWATLCLGALPIEKFGRPALRDSLLPGVIDGSIVLTAALEEPASYDVLLPVTSAEPDGTGWRLSGEKVAVPYGPVAQRILVSATRADGRTGLFVVDPRGEGADLGQARSTTGEPLGYLRLDGAYVDSEAVLGGRPGQALAFVHQLGLAGLCATAAGVLDGGLRMTASYISGRQQFGRPVATFQGAALRIADAYIDTKAVSVAAWSAIWRLSAGRPADESLAIAKYWAADGGQRAVHAFQHLHGGIGVDLDYPVHRYFTWAKAIELTLGGATTQLLRIGDGLAAGTR